MITFKRYKILISFCATKIKMKTTYLSGIGKYATTALAIGTLSFSNYARADITAEQEVPVTNAAYNATLETTNSNYQTGSSLESSVAQEAPTQNTTHHKSSGGSFFPFIILYWWFFMRNKD